MAAGAEALPDSRAFGADCGHLPPHRRQPRCQGPGCQCRAAPGRRLAREKGAVSLGGGADGLPVDAAISGQVVQVAGVAQERCTGAAGPMARGPGPRAEPTRRGPGGRSPSAGFAGTYRADVFGTGQTGIRGLTDRLWIDSIAAAVAASDRPPADRHYATLKVPGDGSAES
jgi:hypothetical protein